MIIKDNCLIKLHAFQRNYACKLIHLSPYPTLLNNRQENSCIDRMIDRAKVINFSIKHKYQLKKYL